MLCSYGRYDVIGITSIIKQLQQSSQMFLFCAENNAHGQNMEGQQFLWKALPRLGSQAFELETNLLDGTWFVM